MSTTTTTPSLRRFRKATWNASSETFEGFARLDNGVVLKAIEHRLDGRAVEAIQLLDDQDQSLVERDPDALCARALACHMAGQTERAVQDLERAEAIHKWKMGAVEVNRADVLQCQDEWEEARQCIRRAVSLRPDIWIFRARLAQAAELCGDAEEAEQHFEHFVALARALPPGNRERAFDYVSRIDDLTGLRSRLGFQSTES